MRENKVSDNLSEDDSSESSSIENVANASVDHFEEHVNRYFSNTVDDLAHLSDDLVKKYLGAFALEVTRLAADNAFQVIENEIRGSIEDYYNQGCDVDSLSIRAHQNGEYEYDLMGEVLKVVDFANIGVNEDILRHIVESSYLHRDYNPDEIMSGSFTATIVNRFVDELCDQKKLPEHLSLKQEVGCLQKVLLSLRVVQHGLQDKIMLMLSQHLEANITQSDFKDNYQLVADAVGKKYPGDTNLFEKLCDDLDRKLDGDGEVPHLLNAYKQQKVEFIDFRRVLSLSTIDAYINNIQDGFAQSMQDERIKELRIKFNKAYERQDWLEVQQIWPVFTKFQRLLVSSYVEQHPKDRSFKYGGRDYPHVKKIGGAAKSETIAPKDKDDLLKLAWDSYQSDAEKYTRLYVKEGTHTLIYSSRNNPDTKTATLDFNPILCELTELGESMHFKLGKSKEANQSLPNVFTPTLYFVVTDRPHQKHGEHKRIFVPVDLQRLVSESPFLLSNDGEDGVFIDQSDEDKRNIAISDCKKGFDIMDVGAPEKFDDTPYRELNHSERVLIEMLRNQDYVEKLIPVLQKNLETILKKDLNTESGKYKVYAVGLLGYSTNSVCDHCTPSLIAQQGSHEEGFLYHLANALNADSSIFKTSGYDLDSRKQDPEKLRMLTIITSSHQWTRQAYHLSEHEGISQGVPRDDKTKENPRGMLILPKHEVDLHQMGSDASGNAYSSHRSFVEASGERFRKYCYSVNGHPNYVATGHSFMSNSKSRIVGEGNRSELDEGVENIMQKQLARQEREVSNWQDGVGTRQHYFSSLASSAR